MEIPSWTGIVVFKYLVTWLGPQICCCHDRIDSIFFYHSYWTDQLYQIGMFHDFLSCVYSLRYSSDSTILWISNQTSFTVLVCRCLWWIIWGKNVNQTCLRVFEIEKRCLSTTKCTCTSKIGWDIRSQSLIVHCTNICLQLDLTNSQINVIGKWLI